MTTNLSNSGTSELFVIVKAAPQVSDKNGETVCCAGIDTYGKWMRLYPVSFRNLESKNKFARWDQIKFSWRLPKSDRRQESRQVNQDTIEVIGQLKPKERTSFLSKNVVSSLNKEREEGRSLALLRPEIKQFVIEKKSIEDLEHEIGRFAALKAQGDMFSKETTPYKPCPYKFKYRYTTDDGDREGTCQDWETEATFFKWEKEYGETDALDKIHVRFGLEYPKKGMVFAMGTHSQYPDVWLINGVVRLDESLQGDLF